MFEKLGTLAQDYDFAHAVWEDARTDKKAKITEVAAAESKLKTYLFILINELQVSCKELTNSGVCHEHLDPDDTR